MSRLELELFRHEVKQTTRHFSRTYGRKINVVFGDIACTDCEDNVMLPVIDEDALTPEMIKAVRGYCDHEAGGHMVFTDKDVFKDLQAKGSPALMFYWNGLEDPRIERLHIEQFPGARKNIESTVSLVCRKTNLPALEKEPPTNDNVIQYGAILASLLGRRAYGMNVPEIDQFVSQFDPAIVQLIDGYARRALHARNSGEVVTLAEQLMQALKAEVDRRQQQQNQPQQPKGKAQKGKTDGKSEDTSAGKGDPSSEAGAGGGDQSRAPSAPGAERDSDEEAGERVEKGGESDAPDGEAGESGAGGEDDPGEDEPDDDASGDDEAQEDDSGDGDEADDDGAGAGSSSYGEGASGAGGGAGGLGVDVIDPSLDVVLDMVRKAQPQHVQKAFVPDDLHMVLKETDRPPADSAAGRLLVAWRDYGQAVGRAGMHEELRKVPAAANNMTKTLLRVLAAKQTRDRHRGLEEGRLDARRLVQAATGSTNVFYRPADRTELDTFVQVLVDCSSSMTRVAGMLGAATAAMGQALEATGVTWACHTFSNLSSDSRLGEHDRVYKVERLLNKESEKAMKEGKQLQIEGELASTVLFEVKGANERLASVAHRVAAMTRLISGGTPTGQAILLLLPGILMRPESKKVLIVLTDGIPNSGDPFHEVIADLKRKGVMAIGLALGNQARTDGFPAAERIATLDDLAKTTLQAIWKDVL